MRVLLISFPLMRRVFNFLNLISPSIICNNSNSKLIMALYSSLLHHHREEAFNLSHKKGKEEKSSTLFMYLNGGTSGCGCT